MTEHRPGVDEPADDQTPDQAAAELAEEADTASPTTAQVQRTEEAPD